MSRHKLEMARNKAFLHFTAIAFTGMAFILWIVKDDKKKEEPKRLT